MMKMIDMKRIYRFFGALTWMAALVSLAACSDFWEPETEDEFNGDQGFTANTEMYTGFLGIMTKVQDIGDKEILLTETRGELIEPTEESNNELIALNNYDQNLQTNSYANPQGYYEVIIACNDYLENMRRYKSRPNVDLQAWECLVASALRTKVWTYKTLAEIYGRAVWFDDPIHEVTEIKSGDRFQLMDLAQLIDKCLTTLDQGFDGVSSEADIDWYEWLDPTHSVSLSSSQYRKWNYMVPAYAGLYAELCLWKGAVLDAANQDATAYYKKAADLMLAALGKQINVTSDPGSNVYWLPSAATPGHYSPIWNNSQPIPATSVCSAIPPVRIISPNTAPWGARRVSTLFRTTATSTSTVPRSTT